MDILLRSIVSELGLVLKLVFEEVLERVSRVAKIALYENHIHRNDSNASTNTGAIEQAQDNMSEFSKIGYKLECARKSATFDTSFV